MSAHQPARVLVVDDQPINIKLLQRKLEREGYEVTTAFNGLECLESVARKKPDLILLDVMMPEMDGIETCAKLKENEETETIPIIFITAKSSKEGKLEGLGVGAVDYITKPIDLEETLARVKTQLRFQEINRENLDLQMRLAESRKTAAIGAITQGIAHNLNNLLGVVVGYLDLLKNGFDSPDMVKRSVSLMDQAIQRMVNIIRQLSTIATKEKIQLIDVPLQELLQSTIERFKTEFGVDTSITVKNNAPEGFKVPANVEVFESLICKLLINAWEAYPKNEPEDNREVWIETEVVSGEDEMAQLLVHVHDDGAGIDPEVKDHLFEPFITTKTSVGRGLGLTMSRHTARNLHGDLNIRDKKDGGAVATFAYPVPGGALFAGSSSPASDTTTA